MSTGRDGSSPHEKDIELISKALIDGRRDDIVILFVPSHDKGRPQKRLNNQDQWAQSTLELFGDLYGGATAFRALQGVWIDTDGTKLFDEPILIQSLAKRERVQNRELLELLFGFIQRMGRDTNQASVGVIFNDVMYYLSNW